MPGLLGLTVSLVAFVGGWLLLFGGLAGWSFGRIVLGAILSVAGLIAWSGLFIVHPNEAVVLVFFGRYLGTARDSGWWLGMPLATRQRISLRVRNFDSQKLKVNDAAGSPIEIGAVVVFRVVDTAKALFDVDHYEQFVAIQSETALRHLASRYPYDTFEEGQHSLRGNADEVAHDLRQELQERLALAGVEVLEARISHLAYAPEIAGAMLQRQQAAAIVAARQTIVQGAVGTVQMALAQLEKEGIVRLDDQQKAAMVNNLLVAIVGERAVTPTIHVGADHAGTG